MCVNNESIEEKDQVIKFTFELQKYQQLYNNLRQSNQNNLYTQFCPLCQCPIMENDTSSIIRSPDQKDTIKYMNLIRDKVNCDQCSCLMHKACAYIFHCNYSSLHEENIKRFICFNCLFSQGAQIKNRQCFVCHNDQGALLILRQKGVKKKMYYVHLVCSIFGTNYITCDYNNWRLSLKRDYQMSPEVQECYLCKKSLNEEFSCGICNCGKRVHLFCAQAAHILYTLQFENEDANPNMFIFEYKIVEGVKGGKKFHSFIYYCLDCKNNQQQQCCHVYQQDSQQIECYICQQYYHIACVKQFDTLNDDNYAFICERCKLLGQFLNEEYQADELAITPASFDIFLGLLMTISTQIGNKIFADKKRQALFKCMNFQCEMEDQNNYINMASEKQTRKIGQDDSNKKLKPLRVKIGYIEKNQQKEFISPRWKKGRKLRKNIKMSTEKGKSLQKETLMEIEEGQQQPKQEQQLEHHEQAKLQQNESESASKKKIQKKLSIGKLQASVPNQTCEINLKEQDEQKMKKQKSDSQQLMSDIDTYFIEHKENNEIDPNTHQVIKQLIINYYEIMKLFQNRGPKITELIQCLNQYTYLKNQTESLNITVTRKQYQDIMAIQQWIYKAIKLLLYDQNNNKYVALDKMYQQFCGEQLKIKHQLLGNHIFVQVIKIYWYMEQVFNVKTGNLYQNSFDRLFYEFPNQLIGVSNLKIVNILQLQGRKVDINEIQKYVSKCGSVQINKEVFESVAQGRQYINNLDKCDTQKDGVNKDLVYESNCTSIYYDHSRMVKFQRLATQIWKSLQPTNEIEFIQKYTKIYVKTLRDKIISEQIHIDELIKLQDLDVLSAVVSQQKRQPVEQIKNNNNNLMSQFGQKIKDYENASLNNSLKKSQLYSLYEEIIKIVANEQLAISDDVYAFLMKYYQYYQLYYKYQYDIEKYYINCPNIDLGRFQPYLQSEIQLKQKQYERIYDKAINLIEQKISFNQKYDQWNNFYVIYSNQQMKVTHVENIQKCFNNVSELYYQVNANLPINQNNDGIDIELVKKTLLNNYSIRIITDILDMYPNDKEFDFFQESYEFYRAVVQNYLNLALNHQKEEARIKIHIKYFDISTQYRSLIESDNIQRYDSLCDAWQCIKRNFDQILVNLQKGQFVQYQKHEEINMLLDSILQKGIYFSYIGSQYEMMFQKGLKLLKFEVILAKGVMWFLVMCILFEGKPICEKDDLGMSLNMNSFSIIDQICQEYYYQNEHVFIIDIQDEEQREQAQKEIVNERMEICSKIYEIIQNVFIRRENSYSVLEEVCLKFMYHYGKYDAIIKSVEKRMKKVNNQNRIDLSELVEYWTLLSDYRFTNNKTYQHIDMLYRNFTKTFENNIILANRIICIEAEEYYKERKYWLVQISKAAETMNELCIKYFYNDQLCLLLSILQKWIIDEFPQINCLNDIMLAIINIHKKCVFHNILNTKLIITFKDALYAMNIQYLELLELQKNENKMTQDEFRVVIQKYKKEYENGKMRMIFNYKSKEQYIQELEYFMKMCDFDSIKKFKVDENKYTQIKKPQFFYDMVKETHEKIMQIMQKCEKGEINLSNQAQKNMLYLSIEYAGQENNETLGKTVYAVWKREQVQRGQMVQAFDNIYDYIRNDLKFIKELFLSQLQESKFENKVISNNLTFDNYSREADHLMPWELNIYEMNFFIYKTLSMVKQFLLLDGDSDTSQCKTEIKDFFTPSLLKIYKNDVPNSLKQQHLQFIKIALRLYEIMRKCDIIKAQSALDGIYNQQNDYEMRIIIEETFLQLFDNIEQEICDYLKKGKIQYEMLMRMNFQRFLELDKENNEGNITALQRKMNTLQYQLRQICKGNEFIKSKMDKQEIKRMIFQLIDKIYSQQIGSQTDNFQTFVINSDFIRKIKFFFKEYCQKYYSGNIANDFKLQNINSINLAKYKEKQYKIKKVKLAFTQKIMAKKLMEKQFKLKKEETIYEVQQGKSQNEQFQCQYEYQFNNNSKVEQTDNQNPLSNQQQQCSQFNYEQYYLIPIQSFCNRRSLIKIGIEFTPERDNILNLQLLTPILSHKLPELFQRRKYVQFQEYSKNRISTSSFMNILKNYNMSSYLNNEGGQLCYGWFDSSTRKPQIFNFFLNIPRAQGENQMAYLIKFWNECVEYQLVIISKNQIPTGLLKEINLCMFRAKNAQSYITDSFFFFLFTNIGGQIDKWDYSFQHEYVQSSFQLNTQFEQINEQNEALIYEKIAGSIGMRL